MCEIHRNELSIDIDIQHLTFTTCLTLDSVSVHHIMTQKHDESAKIECCSEIAAHSS